jgi:hypothetical protein
MTSASPLFRSRIDIDRASSLRSSVLVGISDVSPSTIADYWARARAKQFSSSWGASSPVRKSDCWCELRGAEPAGGDRTPTSVYRHTWHGL